MYPDGLNQKVSESLWTTAEELLQETWGWGLSTGPACSWAWLPLVPHISPGKPLHFPEASSRWGIFYIYFLLWLLPVALQLVRTDTSTGFSQSFILLQRQIAIDSWCKREVSWKAQAFLGGLLVLGICLCDDSTTGSFSISRTFLSYLQVCKPKWALASFWRTSERWWWKWSLCNEMKTFAIFFFSIYSEKKRENNS